MQEVDDDRLATGGDQPVGGGGDAGLVQRADDLSVRVDAFVRLQTQFTRNDRIEMPDQPIGLRPGAAAEFQNVAKAPRGDQANLGDLAFQQRIRGRRGPVHDRRHVAERDARRLDRRQNAEGLVLDRGRHLGEPGLAVAHGDQVGEGPAHIDADHQCHLFTRPCPGSPARRPRS